MARKMKISGIRIRIYFTSSLLVRKFFEEKEKSCLRAIGYSLSILLSLFSFFSSEKLQKFTDDEFPGGQNGCISIFPE